MGDYTRQPDTENYNNRPTYKHVDKNYFFFYNDDGYWMIWNEPRGTSGFISTVKPGLLHIPEKGWEYSLDNGWHYDSLLTVSYEGIL